MFRWFFVKLLVAWLASFAFRFLPIRFSEDSLFPLDLTLEVPLINDSNTLRAVALISFLAGYLCRCFIRELVFILCLGCGVAFGLHLFVFTHSVNTWLDEEQLQVILWNWILTLWDKVVFAAR